MKRIVAVLIVVLCFGVAWADSADPIEPSAEKVSGASTIPDAVLKCPTKGMVDDCMTCHTKPNFKIKEADPFEGREVIGAGEYIFWGDEVAGYIKIDQIAVDYVQRSFEYFDRQPDVKTMVVEIDSYGGSMFDMWGLVGMFEKYYDRFHIITICKSTAFSAGLPTFLAGETRLCTPHAQFMWHEVSYWSFLKKSFPSGLEEEAETMRRWQNQGDAYIASRTNKKAGEIHDKVAFKEWWFNGKEGLEFGVCTRAYAEGEAITKAGDGRR